MADSNSKLNSVLAKFPISEESSLISEKTKRISNHNDSIDLTHTIHSRKMKLQNLRQYFIKKVFLPQKLDLHNVNRINSVFTGNFWRLWTGNQFSLWVTLLGILIFATLIPIFRFLGSNFQDTAGKGPDFDHREALQGVLNIVKFKSTGLVFCVYPSFFACFSVLLLAFDLIVTRSYPGLLAWHRDSLI